MNKPTATIELGNIGDEDQARKIRRILQGETYFNFFVDLSSGQGNWPVTVSTEYEGATEEDLRSLVTFVLACSV